MVRTLNSTKKLRVLNELMAGTFYYVIGRMISSMFSSCIKMSMKARLVIPPQGGHFRADKAIPYKSS
jgi:hypothetical protein